MYLALIFMCANCVIIIYNNNNRSLFRQINNKNIIKYQKKKIKLLIVTKQTIIMLTLENSLHILLFSASFFNLNSSVKPIPLNNLTFGKNLLFDEKTNPSDTFITTLNCTKSKDCFRHSVCYHARCRCKLGFLWKHAQKKCVPKKCEANYECFNVYGNSMCYGKFRLYK